MSQGASSRAGFSAVELLVTLFVAAMFLLIGNRLYTAIIEDSGAARQRARASNLAYDYLRRYDSSTSGTCTAQTVLDNEAISSPPEGLSNVTVTVTKSCPNSALDTLTKTQATITYGSGESISHAVYTAG